MPGALKSSSDQVLVTGAHSSATAAALEESQQFSLPKPGGMSHYHASYQAQMMAAGKIRSKSHIRSEGMTSQYSPCPKIPSATGDQGTDGHHYALNHGLPS